MTVISVGRAGKEIGDYNLDGVKEGLASGYFLATDWGWYNGLPEWRPLPDIVQTLNASVQPLAALLSTAVAAVPAVEPAASVAAPPTQAAQNLTPQNGQVAYVLKGTKRKKRAKKTVVIHSWRDDPATEKQIVFLGHLKAGQLPSDLTKGQAHDLIQARIDGHQFLTPKQMACLSYHGFDPSSLGFDEAKDLLDKIHQSPQSFSVPEPWETAKYHLYPNLYPQPPKQSRTLLYAAILVIGLILLVLLALSHQ